MKKNSGSVLIIGIIFVILVSVGVGFVISKAMTPASPLTLTKQEDVQQKTQEVTKTPPTSIPPTIQTSPPPAPTYTDPNVKTFTSADLSIRFSYLEKQQTPGTMGAKQVGNKVYVYDIKYPADQGQYVEVFTKEKGDTLEATLSKMFLKGYSTTNCFAEKISDPVGGQKNPASFVFAHITFPKNDNDGLEEMDAKAQKCPKGYTETNGIAYFANDTNHPTQFAFFSIGQYAIDGPNSTTWQNTIEFLK
ncbi:hypothetical protein HY947_01115 [Candidatus Gottesmanbacteria bacterium]|nr:hypothetical protein [Candidatus Gottesmanbacteria bacterium]